MIECIATTLESRWLGKIRTSSFFEIIIDTMKDIMKTDQLSIVVKYAVIFKSEYGQKIEVREVSLGFYAIIKHGEVNLVNQVITLFSYKDLDIK
jgi:hypothetical protein